MLESLGVQTQAAPFFLFSDSLCLSAAPFAEISNLQLSVDMLASPRKGERWIREGTQNPSDRGTPLPHALQHGVPPHIGVQPPPALHLPLSGCEETQH